MKSNLFFISAARLSFLAVAFTLRVKTPNVTSGVYVKTVRVMGVKIVSAEREVPPSSPN